MNQQTSPSSSQSPFLPGLSSFFFWVTGSIALLVVLRTGIWQPNLNLQTGVLTWVTGYLLVMLPFDAWAGVFKRSKGFLVWLRGATLQALLFLIMGLLMGWVTELTHAIWGAWLVFLVEMLLLAGLQVWIASLTASFTMESGSFNGIPVVWLQSKLKAFSGGITGLPGQETLVLPKGWENQLPEKAFRVVQLRRASAINQKSHGWGVLIALGWNLLCFIPATYLASGERGSAVWVIEVCLGYSLLNLLGLFTFLPLLAKRAAFTSDQWAYFQNMDVDTIRQSFRQTSAWTDGNFPHRFPLGYGWATANDRDQALRKQQKAWGAFQVAGLSLYYGWAAMNPFSRAWPGTTGKPELWVFSPGD